MPISESMLLIQINFSPTKLNIIQVYGLTADKSDELIETLYDDLTNIVKKSERSIREQVENATKVENV